MGDAMTQSSDHEERVRKAAEANHARLATFVGCAETWGGMPEEHRQGWVADTAVVLAASGYPEDYERAKLECRMLEELHSADERRRTKWEEDLRQGIANAERARELEERLVEAERAFEEIRQLWTDPAPAQRQDVALQRAVRIASAFLASREGGS